VAVAPAAGTQRTQPRDQGAQHLTQPLPTPPPPTPAGSQIFMAPEVWRGLPYGYSSDLFSLGCVLYNMMTFK